MHPPPPPFGSRSDWLAIDAGGANLKAADGRGFGRTVPFALWREWRRLPKALAEILAGHPADRLAVTMTGEIADCFADRAAGVSQIVAACVEAAAGRPVFFYSLAGTLVEPHEATAKPLEVAASNWHALARLAGSLVPAGRGLLLDIGSTTTDIVPLVEGRPAPQGWTDWSRMACGELLYQGVERTPVAALVRTLPHRGRRRPVASECFATTRDAWLILGGLPERPGDHETADGQPATRAAARVRLARTLLVEPAAFDQTDAAAAADWIAEVQCRRLAAAIQRQAVTGNLPDAVVVAGHGSLLAERVISRLGLKSKVIPLPDRLGPELSRVGPAHALALIAWGQL